MTPTIGQEAKALGLLPRIGAWLHGIWTAPKRLRELEAKVAGSADARAGCRACATGRVSVIGLEAARAGSRTLNTKGVCDTCGRAWEMSRDGAQIEALWGDPDDGGPSVRFI